MTDPVVTQPPSDPTYASRSMADPRLRNKRVLACTLCQQRKVKCDRIFPCANCKRSGVQCVPTTTPQPRRRRFAERDLLDRLRQYEALLRQNHVDFKPLHPPNAAGAYDGDTVRQDEEGTRASTEEVAVNFDGKPESVDFLQAIKKMTMEPEEEVVDMSNNEADNEMNPHIKNSPVDAAPTSKALLDYAWQYASHVDKEDCNPWFLFGTPQANLDLSSLHPDQAQTLRLWQIYLENVDPLLKCTHSPTLQASIIDAVGHMADISPTMEALMFSIYCVSIMSLADDECLARFGSPRQNLLAEYQGACQQALLKCKAWRSGEMHALTALYLYLISLRPNFDPRSLSAVLAVVLRNAQRMGLHDEVTNVKFTVLEAEMRRRLWWSLVTFDHRVCEMTEYKTSTLTPIWDCQLPLNTNDFELRSEMKTLPVGHKRPTEALFPFLWSEVANSLRHSAFHLSFVNPVLNTLRRPSTANSDGNEVEAYEATIERHLSVCEPDDPLGFMTIWMVRGQLARHHLLAYYAKHSKESVQQTQAQRSTALSHALNMLECDTKIRTSPLTKRFLWLANFHVPAIAYFHVINHSKKQPDEPRMEDAWRLMRDNWNARAANRDPHRKRNEQMTFEGFVQVVKKGWDAFGAAMRRDMEDELLEKDDLLEVESREDGSTLAGPNLEGQLVLEDNLVNIGTDLHPNMAGQSIMGGEMAHFWTAMDWRFMDPQAW